jgi:hypothetical protein
MTDYIDRVAKALNIEGVTTVDIHDMLINVGMSEYQAYLTFIAGRMIHNARSVPT